MSTRQEQSVIDPPPAQQVNADVDQLPRRRTPMTRWIARNLLRLSGWKIVGQFPNLPKFVCVAAPHTSNWDFFYGYCAVVTLDLRASWVGKHTLFRWPMGPFMRWMGGVPINRSRTKGAVEQLVSIMNSRRQFVIGLAPEGTRSRAQRWRTGFYHLAHQAGVPIVLCYFDYSKRVVGIGPMVEPSGDFEADLAEMLLFYEDKVPRRPALFAGKKDGA